MRKQREYNWLEFFRTRLKILGRVILSCQFKSGPGHQLKTISNTYLRKRTQRYLDISGHDSTATDASMMWRLEC
jgi:hypothetical protein